MVLEYAVRIKVEFRFREQITANRTYDKGMKLSYMQVHIFIQTTALLLEVKKMEFRRAASVSDLKGGEKLGIVLEGEPILLVNLENEYYAIGGKCTHRGCMLSDGTLVGSRIQCLCHGSTFELKTGAVYKGPATKPEPSYRVRVKDDVIQVEV